MQTIRRGWAATLIVASLVGIFAVEIAPAAGALSMKACQLVTAKDVEAVLGGGYTPQSITENQIMSVCGYNKGGDNVVGVSLQQTIYDSAQYLNMEHEGIKQRGGAVTSVAGLGEGGKPNIDAAQKLGRMAYSRLR